MISKELSILIYVVSFSFSIYLFYIYNKTKNKVLKVISLGIPIILAGMRNYVGTDYELYVNIYYKYLEGVSIFSRSSKEFLYLFLGKIALLFNNYKILFFLSAIITVFFIVKAIEESGIRYIVISYCIYIYIYYLESWNIGRQHIALAISLYALKFVFRRKLLKYFIWITIATLFHTSAILNIGVYFIYAVLNQKSIRILYKVGIIGLIVFVINYIEIIKFLGQNISIFKRYLIYAVVNNESGRNYIFYLKIILFSIIFFHRKKLEKINRKNKLYITLVFLDLIITYIGKYNVWLKRLGLYFYIDYIFLLPELISVYKEKKIKNLIRVLIFIYVFLIFILTYYILGHGDIVPYKI